MKTLSLRRLGFRTTTGGTTPPVPYVPTDDADLRVWLDPHDPASYTLNGSNEFTAATNKASGAAFSVNGTPTRIATGINSLPAVEFNSVVDFFFTTEAAIVAAGQNYADLTVMFVAQKAVADAFACAVSWANSGQAGTQDVLFYGTTTAGSGSWGFLSRTSASVLGQRDSTVGMDANPHVHEYVLTSGVLTYYLDGVLTALNSSAQLTGTVAPNRFGIGAFIPSTPANAWTGFIAGTLAWSSAKAADRRALARAYLAAQNAIPVV